ncbi:MAG: glycosyltransferase family 4 protein [bacterium]|nr:glycosyltransferase family 4 protein [bacterium]
MHIYYIGNIRIPTEKAHGSTVAKSCEALARAGANVTLVVPRRKTQFKEDIFETYGVEKIFTVRCVPTLDLLRLSGAQWAFWGSYAVFYIFVFFALLRVPKKDAVIYTREAPLLTLSALGMPAILECHHVFAKRKLYFWLARKAKGIVTISAALKQAFVSAGFSDKKIIVAPSGVDLSIFANNTTQTEARSMLGLPRERAIVVYTGNFTTMGADKGISDILKSLKRLPDVMFVAVGGSEKDRTHYDKEAQDLGVEAQVELKGFVPQATLALYQKAADSLLMPFPDTPHYRSNMSPVKMFEYMASGRPIITSDLPTIREVLNEKNAGLVPPGDSRALADTIRTLLSEPERGQRLAEQAQREVLAYSWDERSKKILSFISSAW